MGVGRSRALELLMESVAEGEPEPAKEGVYFDSNGEACDPGVHHDNPAHDMVAPGSLFAQVTAGTGEADVADTEPPTGDTFVSEESPVVPGPEAKEAGGDGGPSSIGTSGKPAKHSRR